MAKMTHPSTPEVIDGILSQLHEGFSKEFYGIWGTAFNYVLSEQYLNESESNKVLQIMLDENLIETAIDDGEVNAQHCSVLITKKGLEIKDSGGWVKYKAQLNQLPITVTKIRVDILRHFKECKEYESTDVFRNKYSINEITETMDWLLKTSGFVTNCGGLSFKLNEKGLNVLEKIEQELEKKKNEQTELQRVQKENAELEKAKFALEQEKLVAEGRRHRAIIIVAIIGFVLTAIGIYVTWYVGTLSNRKLEMQLEKVLHEKDSLLKVSIDQYRLIEYQKSLNEKPDSIK